MPTDPTPDPKPTPDDPAPDPKPAANDGDLGDAGKKALSEERKARRDADRRAKAAEDELEKLRAESATEAEKAIAAAKAEGRAEALKIANERLVKAEVKAAAAGKFTNPDLAVKVLDLDDFEVGDDGTVDTKAISSAIDEFLEQNPELGGKPGRPSGDGGGGPRGTPAAPSPDDWLRSKVFGKS